MAEQLDKVEDKAREIEAEAVSASELLAPSTAERAPDDRFQSLLAISPSAAILDVWKPVERRLTQMVKTVYGDDAKYLLPRRAAEKLAADGAITPLVVQMVQDLQQIRNEAAHSTEVSASDALRFNQLAMQVTSFLLPTVYVEALPKGRPEGSAITDYVVEDHADDVLATKSTQREAIDWAKSQGRRPLVTRVRHLNDKKKPDHWREA